MFTSATPRSIVRQRPLKSLDHAGGTIVRELVTIGKQPVVLLRKTHPILRPHFTSAEWRAFAAQSSLPEVLRSEVAEWNRKLRFSANCHTVAIGAFLGLTGDEWLEGSRGRITLMNNPAQDLLDQFFTSIHQDASLDTVLATAQPDDVIVFRHRDSAELIHSGRIRWVDGQCLLLSKFGEHPVAVVPLEAAAATYGGQYDALDVYRWAG